VKRRPTIHYPSSKIGIGRGLELQSEEGVPKERASGAMSYSRWKAQRLVVLEEEETADERCRGGRPTNYASHSFPMP